mgnify:CR=1 FL=1
MRNRFMNFMQGRYGTDPYNKFLLIVSMVLLALSIFLPWTQVRSITFWIAFGILIYSYFRTFSRNYAARASENDRYLRSTERFRSFRYRSRYKADERRHYKVFKCPSCSQKIRIPRGKGKIEISCPKCSAKFIRRT